MRTKTDNFGLLAIVIGVVSGIWIFGFADDVFSVFQNYSDDVSDNVFYINSNEQEYYVFTESDAQTNLSSSQTIENESVLSNPTSKLSESTPTPNEPLDQNDEKKVKRIETQISHEKKILQLEEQTFRLSGDGDGYEGAAHLSESARLNFELYPVSGTNLTEFDIEKGTLRIGDYTFVIEGGIVTLDDDVISISIEHDDHRDPYLDMTGIARGSIFNDKSLDITFENQLLGLTKDDQTPIHLNLELTLEIKP